MLVPQDLFTLRMRCREVREWEKLRGTKEFSAQLPAG